VDVTSRVARGLGALAITAVLLAGCTGAQPPASSTGGTPTSAPRSTLAASLPPTLEPITAITPAPTPDPTVAPTPVPVPPKPTGVKFDEQVRVSDDESVADITQSVTWRAPRSDGVEIRVYGVTECIAEPANPAPDTRGPCLVVHTSLPASVRRLLAKAPASAGVVSWTWTEETGCDPSPFASAPDGPTYYSVVLAAYNESDHSIFAIAEAGGWWQPGPNDTVC